MSAASTETTPLTEPLDAFLREVVQTLHAAVSQGIQAVQDDPARTERVIEDCKEIIGTIMAGRVDEWLA